MFFHIIICAFLSTTDILTIVYTLFMSKNFTDCAILCSQLLSSVTKGNSTLENLFRLLFLLVICGGAFHLILPRLFSAVEYTRSQSAWGCLLVIPILFFIMFRFTPVDLLPGPLPPCPNWLIVMTVCWLVCIGIIHYVILYALSNLYQNCTMKEQYKTIRLLTSVQTSQMEQLQQTLDHVAEVRHNFRHHFITVKGLIEEGNDATALDYIDAYLGSIQSLYSSQYCSNLSANSLLNYYLGEAKKHYIQVTANVSLSQELSMPIIDFCTILGNLLSNALESCLRQEPGSKPFITVNIRQTGVSMITLSIRNSYSHKIQEKEGRFLSSKRDDMGTGTESVRYLVKQYHGILRYQYQDGIFEVSILLNPGLVTSG
jgi:hypothetical protein